MTSNGPKPRLTIGRLTLAVLLGASIGAYAYHTLSKPESSGLKAEFHALEAAAQGRQEWPLQGANCPSAGDRKIGPLSAQSQAELADPAARARLASDIKVAGSALAATPTNFEFKRDKTPFEGPNARAQAHQTINDFGLPCADVTALAFVKAKNEVKIFKAQCDHRKWYILLQSSEGQKKVFEWNGAGEPH